jgi:protein AATF/BFR2
VNHAFIDDADDQDGGVSGGSKSGNGGRRQHPTEPEIFDDGDFYQTLLKQLIESGLSETADPVEMSRQWLQVKSATRKMHRADVDRRASKGRKLRYTEHQQLLSFMAPQTARYKQADSVQASQLSLTIFGLRPDPQQPSATAASG